MRRGGRSVQRSQHGTTLLLPITAPTITNPGSQHSYVESIVSLALEATGTTGWEATGLPAGTTINPATGVISGTLTTVGSYSVTVTAKGPGGEAHATFEWVIAAVPAPEPEPKPEPEGHTVAPDFEEALVDLQDHLPYWWESRNPESALYSLLSAGGALLDELAWLFEKPFLNSVLDTADEEGLLRNFAYAWGLENEQLPPTTEQLRAYIKACAESDGSLNSLVATLTALLETPVNVTGGPILTFPGGGEGLTFPTNGAGLPLYQFEPGEEPKAALVFPANGEGLHFPVLPSLLPSDNMIGDTGETAPGAGPGLIFSQNGFVAVQPNTPGPYQFTVEVCSWLTFDRKAFQRAVERYEPADCLPAAIREVEVV
jgi:Putative Ig domain